MAITVDYEQAEKLDAALLTLLSNRMAEVTNSAASATNLGVVAGTGNKKDAASPDKASSLAAKGIRIPYSPALLQEVLAILRKAAGIISFTPLPGPGSRLQEELEQMRAFLYPVSVPGKKDKDAKTTPGKTGDKKTAPDRKRVRKRPGSAGEKGRASRGRRNR